MMNFRNYWHWVCKCGDIKMLSCKQFSHSIDYFYTISTEDTKPNPLSSIRRMFSISTRVLLWGSLLVFGKCSICTSSYIRQARHSYGSYGPGSSRRPCLGTGPNCAVTVFDYLGVNSVGNYKL